MTNPPRLRLLVCATLAITTLSSCVYDPYSRSSVSSRVGYSNRNFSTSMMVRTSDSRWFYDPDCLSYYDTHRRCYYDPYLRGYYPVGYRPPMIIGAPHPYGWHRGVGVCRPPGQVRSTWLNNHHDRYRSYCNLNESWSRQCRPGNDWNHGDDHRGNEWNRGDENRYGANRNPNGWSSSNNSGNNNSTRNFWGRPESRGTQGSNGNNRGWQDDSGASQPSDKHRNKPTYTSTPASNRSSRGNSGSHESSSPAPRVKESRPEKQPSPEKQDRGNSKKHHEEASWRGEPRMSRG